MPPAQRGNQVKKKKKKTAQSEGKKKKAKRRGKRAYFSGEDKAKPEKKEVEKKALNFFWEGKRSLRISPLKKKEEPRTKLQCPRRRKKDYCRGGE